MARFFAYLLALATVSVSVYQTQAVPIESRQLGGGIACNVARLKTVGGLAAAKKAVQKLIAAAGGDAATASAAASAQSGLTSAGAGIKTIAGALLTGKAAPDAARTQVGQGLLAAQTALGGINSTSSTVQPLVSAAQQQVQGTISAGQDVVSQCGGSGSASSSSSTAADSTASAATNNTSSAATTVDTTAPAAATSVASNSGASGSGGLSARQIGNLACNVARLQTVSRLAATSQAAQDVSTAASGDATTVAAAGNALAALSSAKSAIGTIAAAIVTGKQAPAAARVQVQQGLTNAQTALSGITSTSTAVKSAVSNALNELTSTQTAGNAVVSNCQ